MKKEEGRRVRSQVEICPNDLSTTVKTQKGVTVALN